MRPEENKFDALIHVVVEQFHEIHGTPSNSDMSLDYRFGAFLAFAANAYKYATDKSPIEFLRALKFESN